jgi:hypothetical protein
MATKKKSKKPVPRGGKAAKPTKKRKQSSGTKVNRKKAPAKKKAAKPKAKRKPAPPKKAAPKKAVKKKVAKKLAEKKVEKIVVKKPAPAKPKATAKKIPVQKAATPLPVPIPVIVEEITEVYNTPDGVIEVTETIVSVDNNKNDSNPGS